MLSVLKIVFRIVSVISLFAFAIVTVSELVRYVVSCIKKRELIPIREATKKYGLKKEVVVPLVLYVCGFCCLVWIVFLGGYSKEDVEAIREEEYQFGYEVGFDDGLDEVDEDSYLSGYEEGKNDGYSTGHDAGYNLGYRTGYSEGFEVLKNRWLEKGYPYSLDDFREQYQTVTVPQNQSGATYQPHQTQQNSYTVYVTDTGNKYHSGGCQYLRESKIPMSLSDAIASGYTACSKCNP